MPPLQVLLNLPFLLPGFGIKFLFFCKKGLGKVYWKGLMRGFRIYYRTRPPFRRIQFTALINNQIRRNDVGNRSEISLHRQVKITRFYIVVLNIVFTSIFRLGLREILVVFRRKGYNMKHILLVGYSQAAEEYINSYDQQDRRAEDQPRQRPRDVQRPFAGSVAESRQRNSWRSSRRRYRAI